MIDLDAGKLYLVAVAAAAAAATCLDAFFVAACASGALAVA